MGYYTRYDIFNNDDEVIQTLIEVSGEDGLEDCEVKWYSCLEDTLKVSHMFPDKLITIHGKGSENGDIWAFYVKNGKSQYEKAQIIVAPFDESKLK